MYGPRNDLFPFGLGEVEEARGIAAYANHQIGKISGRCKGLFKIALPKGLDCEEAVDYGCAYKLYFTIKLQAQDEIFITPV